MTIPYKLLFCEHYASSKPNDKKRAYFYAARSLELIRMEQWLAALSCQELAKISWPHCNKIFFALIHQHDVSSDYELMGVFGSKKTPGQHLKGIFKLKSSNNSDESIDVYWVLEKADIPSDLKFVPDEKDNRHYFLTVTKKITVETLVKKLKWVADRMSVIKDGSRALK